MPGLYFDELTVGQMFKHPLRRTITEADNVVFSALTHNPALLHLDEEYCRTETEFGQRIVNSAFTLGHLGARADFVVLHWTACGTHRGTLLGVPPTGKRITRRGTAIYCLVDGRIAEEWGYFDLRGLLRQLGADAASWQGEVAVNAGAER